MLAPVSTRCHTCDEPLEDDARFCGVCGVGLVDENFGRTIAGRYVLRQRVGKGSLGAVYKAEQPSLRRKLAIKLLPGSAQRDATTVERFRREGHVLVNLRSHHTFRPQTAIMPVAALVPQIDHEVRGATRRRPCP